MMGFVSDRQMVNGAGKGSAFSRFVRQFVYMVMELAHTDLYRAMRHSRFTWQGRLQVLADCVGALCYMRGLDPKVFHCDMNSQNCLINGDGRGKVHSKAGTAGYVDPGFLETGIYSASCNVYSVVILLLE
ncbi:unnamed protein product, partial [Effrenium voratum]